jgi:hypothetical protein
LEAAIVTPAQKNRRGGTANKNAGLAQLLTFWVNDGGKILGERELVILTLESVRDDIAQASTIYGRRVPDPQVVRDYLNEQIAELRRVWKMAADAAD